jgi:hypothetical protein
MLKKMKRKLLAEGGYSEKVVELKIKVKKILKLKKEESSECQKKMI